MGEQLLPEDGWGYASMVDSGPDATKITIEIHVPRPGTKGAKALQAEVDELERSCCAIVLQKTLRSARNRCYPREPGVEALRQAEAIQTAALLARDEFQEQLQRRFAELLGNEVIAVAKAIGIAARVADADWVEGVCSATLSIINDPEFRRP